MRKILFWFEPIIFSSIVKQAILHYVNHNQIRSWNKQVRSNDGQVSCSRKQQDWPITSQTLYTQRNGAPVYFL